MPPQSSSIAAPKRDPLLKRYRRSINNEDEDRIDEEILTSIGPFLDAIGPSLDAIGPVAEENRLLHFAIILSTFISFSFKNLPLKKDYKDAFNNMELLKEHPLLLSLLIECVRERKFRKIRDLKIFKPTKNPQAVQHVQDKYGDLFTRLSIIVKSFNAWNHEDIADNNGHLYTSDVAPNQEDSDVDMSQDGTPPGENQSSQNNIPEDIRPIQERLRRIRTFYEQQDDTPPDLDLVRQRYPTEFELVFGRSEDITQNVATDREYVSLFNINRCYVADTVLAANSSSSTFKSNTFCINFIHPSLFYPFLDSEELAFRENQIWGFPVFINVQGNAAITKYTPRNDWSVVKRIFRLPLVISQIISQKNESDEIRMLLQAIALARAGGYFMKPSSTKPFFIVAIYLTANLQVRRYILKPESKDARAKVNIVKETFNLADRTRASIFLLEMLNLSSDLRELADEFDPDKANQLSQLQKAAQGMTSLTTMGSTGKTTGNEPGTEPMETVPEESGGEESDEGEESEEREVSRFDSIEVRQVLDHHGYTVGFADAFHPNVALIFDKAINKPVEYLKFMKDGSKELEILHYLEKIESPRNHAIRPIRSWAVKNGRMVSLPRGGIWITDLKSISKHLWDLARQLFEGVDFLHKNNVAHMDLKPHNLVIPASYGRLSIIDFGVSVRLRKPTHKMTGRVGSEGYIAPEVGQKAYNPIKADLYSCGVVISELCLLAGPSVQRDALSSIASRLTECEPNNRPLMSEILTWLDTHIHNETVPELPLNGLSMPT